MNLKHGQSNKKDWLNKPKHWGSGKMPLPEQKGNRHNKMKNKICCFEGCGKEYYGHVISRYCLFHQKIENRGPRKKKTFIDNNKIHKHNFHDVTDVEFYCAACSAPFKVKIFPKVFVYPNFCPDHVNEFKRELYLKNNKKEKVC